MKTPLKDRLRAQRWKRAHREWVLSYTRAWKRARRAHVATYNKRYRKEHPEAAVRSESRRQQRTYAEKVVLYGAARTRAHEAVKYALKTGRLKRKPCERCRAKNTHAHHPDYSKPLMVKWLCPACHWRVHHRRAA